MKRIISILLSQGYNPNEQVRSCSPAIAPALFSHAIATLTLMTQVNPVFTEKTVATSMAVSMVAWALSTARGSQELRRNSFEFLSALANLCIRSGEFELTVVPEIHVGLPVL